MSGYNIDYETAWIISLIFKINTNIYVYAEITYCIKKKARRKQQKLK